MCEASVSNVIKYSSWRLAFQLSGIKRNMIQRMSKEKLSQKKENFVKQKDVCLYQLSKCYLLENVLKVILVYNLIIYM